MTTITIERAFLIKVLDQLDIAQSLLERSQHHAKMAAMYEELRAALAAPATAPEKTVKEIMEFVRHYAADTFSSATLEDKIRRSLAAPATAPAWYDAQQAEIESLRWTVKDALESLDNGMTADCRATLSSATKETP